MMEMQAITPNDAGIMDASDSKSIQNAVREAKKTGLNRVIIPRCNQRTGQCRWDIDEAIILPSEIQIVLDNCYLRQADGCMDNVFRNFEDEAQVGHTMESETHDIFITGIGNAVIDGGESNGLTEATQKKNGLPSVRKNNMILFYHLRNFAIEHVTLKNQRWWAINLLFAERGRLSDLHIEARSTVPNQDGIDLRVGCHDILIENITGQAGDDMIALSALNKRIDGRPHPGFPFYVEEKDEDIHDVIIRNIIATSISCAVIALHCTDGAKIYHVTIDGVFDTLNGCRNLNPPEPPFLLKQDNKKLTGFISPYAVIRIGQDDYFKVRTPVPGEIYGITATNIHARCNAAVMINCTLEKSYFGNIYAENGADNIVTTKSDWLHQTFGADIRDTVFENIFFQCTDNPDAVAFEFVQNRRPAKLKNVLLRNAFVGNCPIPVRMEQEGELDIQGLFGNHVKNKEES